MRTGCDSSWSRDYLTYMTHNICPRAFCLSRSKLILRSPRSIASFASIETASIMRERERERERERFRCISYFAVNPGKRGTENEK